MSFIERFKFYLIGVLAGTFLVILIFGKRNSCKDMVTNYLPGGRVLLEMKSKPIFYSNDAMAKLEEEDVDTASFRNDILPKLDINFDLSDQRAEPCGKYVAYYQDSTHQWKLNLEKCKDKLDVKSIEDYFSNK